jgi:hypothetical protein
VITVRKVCYICICSKLNDVFKIRNSAFGKYVYFSGVLLSSLFPSRGDLLNMTWICYFYCYDTEYIYTGMRMSVVKCGPLYRQKMH